MLKTTEKPYDFDIYNDLEQIKSAISKITQDACTRSNEYLNKGINQAKERSLELRKDVSEYVNKKPLQSLGMAVAAGILLGWLIKK